MTQIDKNLFAFFCILAITFLTLLNTTPALADLREIKISIEEIGISERHGQKEYSVRLKSNEPNFNFVGGGNAIIHTPVKMEVRSISWSSGFEYFLWIKPEQLEYMKNYEGITIEYPQRDDDQSLYFSRLYITDLLSAEKEANKPLNRLKRFFD